MSLREQNNNVIWGAVELLHDFLSVSDSVNTVIGLTAFKFITDGTSSGPTFSALLDAIEGGTYSETLLGRALSEAESVPGLFSDVVYKSPKLGKTPDERQSVQVELLRLLSALDFDSFRTTSADFIGDTYEFLLSQFGTKGRAMFGEFYTPAGVADLILRIVAIVAPFDYPVTVYDPTCGSGSLLYRVGSALPDGFIKLCGQEKNPTTCNLSRINMIFHGIGSDLYCIEHGDTLTADALPPDKAFPVIVANPPFGVRWSPDKLKDDPRFAGWDALPPRNCADFAFLLHMWHRLHTSGVCVCVASTGVLFRGRSEGKIRRQLIEQYNGIEAVVGLPPNLFYGTGIAPCLLVLRKDRPRGSGVLFVDASKGFQKGKKQNRLRQGDIARVAAAFQRFTTGEPGSVFEEKFCRVVPLDEIRENGYNLNIPRYINPYDDPQPVDISIVLKEIRELEAERAELDKELAGYLAELGIDFNIGDDAKNK